MPERPTGDRHVYDSINEKLSNKLLDIAARNQQAAILEKRGTQISDDFVTLLREELQKPYGTLASEDRQLVAKELTDVSRAVATMFEKNIPLESGIAQFLEERRRLIDAAQLEAKIATYLPTKEEAYLETIPYGKVTSSQRELIKSELNTFQREVQHIHEEQRVKEALGQKPSDYTVINKLINGRLRELDNVELLGENSPPTTLSLAEHRYRNLSPAHQECIRRELEALQADVLRGHHLIEKRRVVAADGPERTEYYLIKEAIDHRMFTLRERFATSPRQDAYTRADRQFRQDILTRELSELSSQFQALQRVDLQQTENLQPSHKP